MKKYPLAPNGIFRTIQGEGLLLGVPMVFVRLAGCSIGCGLCDTDYSLDKKVSLDEIVAKAKELTDGLKLPWVWLTGGEPTDHDLMPLVLELRNRGLWVALATAGHKQIRDEMRPLLNFLSVSPHHPKKWVQKDGDELKIVPRLSGWNIEDFTTLAGRLEFHGKYVIPCDTVAWSVGDCIKFIETNPEWKMGVQAHKLWKIA